MIEHPNSEGEFTVIVEVLGQQAPPRPADYRGLALREVEV